MITTGYYPDSEMKVRDSIFDSEIGKSYFKQTAAYLLAN